MTWKTSIIDEQHHQSFLRTKQGDEQIVSVTCHQLAVGENLDKIQHDGGRVFDRQIKA